MPRLTDKQRKLIIADYIECQSYNAVAKKYNISATTVKKWVLRDTESVRKCEEKKEQNTRDVLDYMDSKADKQKEIIDLSMDAIIKKLKKPDPFTSVKDIATAYGIIIDKAIKSKEIKYKHNTNNNDNRKTVIVDDLPKWD